MSAKGLAHTSQVDARPVIFLEPLQFTDAEVVVNKVGDCSSAETGREIALAVSTQAIKEARVDVEKTQKLLSEMETSDSNWCMVRPVYQDCLPDGLQPGAEDRLANVPFWKALTRILEPLRAVLAPFID